MAGPKLRQLSALTIDTAGVREAISGNSLLAQSVIIVADPLNTGKIYVGDSSVSSSNGIPLGPEESVTITAEAMRGIVEDIDLSDIYVDTATNGNVARISYLARR